MKKINPTTALLWLIYVFLLAVLLPHTAWAFRAFEPNNGWVIYEKFTSADAVSYVAALAFEAAIAVLTHKLSKHIEQTVKEAKRLQGWPKFQRQYMNAFSLGLVIATVVSSLANLAHAVQFAQPLEIFSRWGVPSQVYVVAFGGILPVVSLLFARVLSNVNESEADEDPALIEAKATITDLRRQIRESEGRIKQAEAARLAAEDRAGLAAARFDAAGDIMRWLVDDTLEKRARILAIHQWKPKLPGNSIAVLVDAAPSYVSEVLKGEIAEVNA